MEIWTFRDNVAEEQARIYYSVWFNLPLEAYSSVCYVEINGYSATANGNSMSGNIIFSNLTEGTSYRISGQASCEYKYKTTETKTEIDENGEKVEVEVEVEKTGSATQTSNNIVVYTHPGSFSMGATTDPNFSNNIIANVLTTEKIDQWIKHFQKAYHWYNQNNNNYNTSLLQIPNNKIVSAKWFNACMDAMQAVGHSTTKVKGASTDPPGDLITASLINQMNFSGKTSI